MYNGSVQSPVIANMDNTYVSVSGNAETYVGTYNAVFTLNNNNVIWSDDTNEFKTVPWEITRMPLDVPGVTNELVYNGEEQSPTIEEYDTNYIEASGDLAATNAGTYTITFALLDKANTMWSDGTISNQTIEVE